MKIQELLNEAVGGNYLYHGVRDGSIVNQILKSGSILPQMQFDFDCEDPEDKTICPDVISLSRDQFLRFPYGDAVAQFVVDKDALKRSGIIAKPQVGARYYKQEAEERVFKPIPVKAPYVVAIQYDPGLKIPQSVIDRAKASGVRVEPWKSVKKDPQEPEYDVNYDANRGRKLEDRIKNILAKGVKPLPDWRQIKITDFGDSASIYYNIPEWTYGVDIQPFTFIPKNFAKKILPQLQQLTKNGQSIRPLMNKYAVRQYDKTWKQGKYQINPGHPKYKEVK
jgi:hypothetical protein